MSCLFNVQLAYGIFHSCNDRDAYKLFHSSEDIHRIEKSFITVFDIFIVENGIDDAEFCTRNPQTPLTHLAQMIFRDLKRVLITEYQFTEDMFLENLFQKEAYEE